MKALFKSRKFLVGIVVFFVGLFWFFPMWIFQSHFVNAIMKSTGVQISSRDMVLGTGLGLGLKRGSLLAIRGQDLSLRLPQGFTFSCRRVVVAPHIVPLFWGQFRAALFCESSKTGELIADAKIWPFWSRDQAQVDVELNKVSMELLTDILSMGNFFGDISGTLSLEKNLKNPSAPIKAEWNLNGEGLQIPSINAVILSLPALRLGKVETKGAFSGTSIKVKSLKFGASDTPIEGDLLVDFGLDSRGMPISGMLEGKLRFEPDFEKGQFKDISLDLMFGKVKASNFREFKKPITGSVMSLLNPPTQ